MLEQHALDMGMQPRPRGLGKSTPLPEADLALIDTHSLPQPALG